METFPVGPLLLYALDIWKSWIGPCLLWWTIATCAIVLLAEITHRLAADNRTAFRAYLWRIAVLVIAVFPVLYITAVLNSDFTNIRDGISANEPVGIFSQTATGEEIATRNVKSLFEAMTLPYFSETFFEDTHTVIWLLAGVIYIVGFMMVLYTRIRMRRRLKKFLSKTTLCTQPEIYETIHRIAEDVHLRKPFSVWISDESISPIVMGLISPILVIPSFMVREWNDKEIVPILSHEINHIQQMDPLYDFIAGVVQTLLWFFPMISWLGGRLVETRETHSDALGVKRCRSSREYAGLILQLAERLLASPKIDPACSFSQNREQILHRFRQILKLGGHPETTLSWKLRTLFLTSLLAFSILLIVLPITASFSPGRIAAPNTTVFDEKTDQYIMQSADNYIAYTRVHGPFSIEATIQCENIFKESLNGWAYLCASNNLAPGNMVYLIGSRIDKRAVVWLGCTTTELDQGRLNIERFPNGAPRKNGSYCNNFVDSLVPESRQKGQLKLSREGQSLKSYYFDVLKQEWVLHDEYVGELNEEISVGIGTWSYEPMRPVRGHFSNVKLIKTVQ